MILSSLIYLKEMLSFIDCLSPIQIIYTMQSPFPLDPCLLPSTPAPDPRQLHLLKTIEIKNKNIDQLLRQLKETQQLYQSYKVDYMAQQSKLKKKVSELASRLQVQESELEKHKLQCAKMRGDIQLMHDREQKTVETHLAQSREEQQIRRELEEKSRRLERENEMLKEQKGLLAQRCSNSEERLLQAQRLMAASREEIRQLREQMEQRRVEWQQQKEALTDKIEAQEDRRRHKMKNNRKLEALQQRILETIQKI